MKFHEKRDLAQRGPIEPLPPNEIPTLLVGEESIAQWSEGGNSSGWDNATLFPAWHDGKRAWLLRLMWCPAFGYSASGTEEEIIDFEEGIKMLIEKGCFDVFFENEAK